MLMEKELSSLFGYTFLFLYL